MYALGSVCTLAVSQKAKKKVCWNMRCRKPAITGERVSDITTLSSDYLIRNIELAFQAWPKPWNKSVSFENFCRYILPYRGLYEPPSGLREELMRTYLPLLDSSHIDNTYDAAVRLQKILRTRVTYQTEIPIHYPTAEEIHRTGVGRLVWYPADACGRYSHCSRTYDLDS